MRLQKYNFPDTGTKIFCSNGRSSKAQFSVVWNPWLDKARETPDFGDDEYPNMVSNAYYNQIWV